MGSILEDTMPGMEILRMYKELGGRIITAGSDSHRPERIGYGFDRVYQMLKEAGFDSISIYKNRKYTAANIMAAQTVDKLGVGSYAQHHFSLIINSFLFFLKKLKIRLYSSLVFPVFLPASSNSCTRR
ncbi:MAG: hypothetical protein ACLTN0_03340 [Coprococcus phoceensis]